MAQRRMTSRRTALSSKLTQVTWFTEALWHRGLPFCDDAGFMPSDPEEVKALLVPRGKNGKQIPLSHVKKALEELESVELISVHSCPIKTCIRYVGFEKFQTLKAGRALQIDCDNPSGITCFPLETIGIQWNPMESKYFLVRGRGSEVKLSEDEGEVEGKVRAPATDEGLRLVYGAWQEATGQVMSSFTTRDLAGLLGKVRKHYQVNELTAPPFKTPHSLIGDMIAEISTRDSQPDLTVPYLSAAVFGEIREAQEALNGQSA